MRIIVLFALLFVMSFIYVEFENFSNTLLIWINFVLFITILFLSVMEIKKLKAIGIKNTQNISKFNQVDMSKCGQNFDKNDISVSKNRKEIVDIFGRLDFVFSSFFDMSSKNRISIVFDYDRNLPNVFSVKIEEFIICIVSALKILQNDIYAKEIITIKMQRDGENEIETFFRLDIILNKAISSDEMALINEAINGAPKNSENVLIYNLIDATKLLGWKFNFICEKSHTKFVINGKFDTQSAKFQLSQLECSANNLSVVIFSSNVYFKNILEKQIKNLRIDAKICNNTECVLEHISDGIYTPFMIFIWVEDYNKLGIDELNLLKEFKSKKEYFITLIIANKNDIISSNYASDFFLISPYSPNTLTKIINQAKHKKSTAENSEFLSGSTPPPLYKFKKRVKTKIV